MIPNSRNAINGFVIVHHFEGMSNSSINLATLISKVAFELLLFRLTESMQSLYGLLSKISVFENQQSRQLALISINLFNQILA